MDVCGAFFGRRGVVGFNGCCMGASSGVWGFKFLMITACRGGTGFMRPLPKLWGGLLVASRVFRAPEGPPARELSARRASLGASSRSTAGPCRRPRARQPGPPVPPHQWGPVADVRLAASSRSPARPSRCHCGRAVHVCPPDRRNRPCMRIGYCDMDRL